MSGDVGAARPTTDSGRWLLDHQGLVNISKPAHHSLRGIEIDLRAAIVTIEREAAIRAESGGLDRDSLYRRIHALPGLEHHGKREQCYPITDAVLAMLADR